MSRPRRAFLFALGIALAAGFAFVAPYVVGISRAAGAQNPRPTGHKLVVAQPAPLSTPDGREVATLAGGCFWAMQTEFEQLRGVDKVVAGYAGGSVSRPSYEQVCTGATGHAETIQITYDPKVISYAELLRIFLTDIDPTTLNRQGNDTGTQYRSAIFYHNEAQRQAAEKAIAAITQEKLYRAPIVTEVVPYRNFYAAEGYHQDYFAHNPDQPYCAAVVAPEVRRFQQMNRTRLKP